MSWSFGGNLKHALKGFKTIVKTEKTFRLHLIIGVLVIFAGWYKQLSDALWVGLLLVIAFILALEIFNSATERLVDILAPKTHSLAGEIKDLLAAMVLLMAIFAIIIAIIIFL